MKRSIYLFVCILILGTVLLLTNQVVKANVGEAVQDIEYIYMHVEM